MDDDTPLTPEHNITPDMRANADIHDRLDKQDLKSDQHEERLSYLERILMKLKDIFGE